MNFPDAIKSCFNNYAKFSGRARRSEYWYWVLFCSLVSGALNTLGAGTAGLFTAVAGVFHLATLIPSLAVAWRRLHDIGRSGWSFVGVVLLPLLIGVMITAVGVFMVNNMIAIIGGVILLLSFIITVIVCIIWLCHDSQPGDNKYGPNPKGQYYDPGFAELR